MTLASVAFDGARFNETLYTWMVVGGLKMEIGFLVDGLHNPIRLCVQDIYYVVKSERRSGAGSLLFNTVEAELKRRGSFRWIVAEKVHMDGGDFFARHGFTHIERSYWKMV
jgi:GNAT superfamily N-acetyltransferase